MSSIILTSIFPSPPTPAKRHFYPVLTTYVNSISLLRSTPCLSFLFDLMSCPVPTDAAFTTTLILFPFSVFTTSSSSAPQGLLSGGLPTCGVPVPIHQIWKCVATFCCWLNYSLNYIWQQWGPILSAWPCFLLLPRHPLRAQPGSLWAVYKYSIISHIYPVPLRLSFSNTPTCIKMLLAHLCTDTHMHISLHS